MITIKLLQICGLPSALHGMRNPLNSWDKADSVPDDSVTGVKMGNTDTLLAMALCKAGSDERKFMRMINVYMDITAPLYFWKQWDTYKVSTVSNSCSTMHTLSKAPITMECFSTEHIKDKTAFKQYIEWVESLRTTDWNAMIQALPSSYNQTRTCMVNYETLHNMYHARKHHKLSEWREFCKFVDKLPYKGLLV